MSAKIAFLIISLVSGLAAAQESTITGRDGWLFFAPEVKHLESDAPADAAVEAIVDFKRQLERAGAELLLVPVPAKATVYPEKLALPVRKGSTEKAVLAALAKQGVNVLDLGPAFAAAKRKAPAPLYCRTDTHWSGEGCVTAAGAIAAAVRARPWFAALPHKPFEDERRTIQIGGDLARGGPKESLSVRLIGTREGTRLLPVPVDRASPVLLLGDSHNLVFHAGGDMFASGAGLPDQLARELGVPVDLVAVRGSGATPARTTLARRARADAAYLGKKKLVIWCFAARELTQSTWQNVPLLPRGGS